MTMRLVVLAGIVLLEVRRAVRLVRGKVHGTPRPTRDRISGQRMGALCRLASVAVLVAFSYRGHAWALITLCAGLAVTAYRPAFEFGLGFAQGLAPHVREDHPATRVAGALSMVVLAGLPILILGSAPSAAPGVLALAVAGALAL